MYQNPQEALFSGCINKDYTMVSNALDRNNVDVNAYDAKGGMPLLRLFDCDDKIDADEGNILKIAKLLIEKKADVNKVHKTTGKTPLHIAAAYGLPACVDCLLQCQAKIEATAGNSASTPLIFAAAFPGNARAIAVLLKADAKIEATMTDGTTALHEAAANGCVDNVAMLMKYCAMADVKDANGKTPRDLIYLGISDMSSETKSQISTLLSSKPDEIDIDAITKKFGKLNVGNPFEDVLTSAKSENEKKLEVNAMLSKGGFTESQLQLGFYRAIVQGLFEIAGLFQSYLTTDIIKTVISERLQVLGSILISHENELASHLFEKESIDDEYRRKGDPESWNMFHQYGAFCDTLLKEEKDDISLSNAEIEKLKKFEEKLLGEKSRNEQTADTSMEDVKAKETISSSATSTSSFVTSLAPPTLSSSAFAIFSNQNGDSTAVKPSTAISSFTQW